MRAGDGWTTFTSFGGIWVVHKIDQNEDVEGKAKIKRYLSSHENTELAI